MRNDNPLTYKTIIDRCKRESNEGLPDLPKTSTVEAWEGYLDSLEDFDVFAFCYETVEQWDWMIYTHYGWKILHALPQSYIDEAESQFLDLNSGMSIEDTCGGTFDIWSIQSQIAYHACVDLLSEQVQTTIDSEYKRVVGGFITKGQDKLENDIDGARLTCEIDNAAITE